MCQNRWNVAIFPVDTFLFKFVLGCRHRNHSRPFTLDNQTYKLCLDCGGVIHYSPERLAAPGNDAG
jgi:hypothetical protein